jgi:monoterpene epsilon-lactone hydrolase
MKISLPLPLSLVKYSIRKFRKKVDWKNIQRSRRGFEKLSTRFAYKSSKCAYEIESVQHCKGEWIRPNGAPENKVLLYFHGGGYAAGSAASYRTMLTKLALYSKLKIFSFEYRLAPEHPYPAALTDAAMAYEWLIEKGYSPDKIALGGDSAGGGLTLATLVYLRDKNKPLPACAICLSPWADLTQSGASFSDEKVEDPMLIRDALSFWAQNYYGNHDPENPYISPLFADCTGLPPIYIHVGSDEIILSDSTRFYEKANAAGVKIKLEIFNNYFHVFHMFWQALSKAKKALKKLGVFLNEQLA